MSLSAFAARMAANLSTDILALNEPRRRLFLEWLSAHSSQIECNWQTVKDGSGMESLETGLEKWLGSLSIAGMLLEHKLILGELAWWRELEECDLASLVKTKA